MWNRSPDLRYDANPVSPKPRKSRSGRLNWLALASLCCGVSCYVLTGIAIAAASISLLKAVSIYLDFLPPVAAIAAVLTGHIARGQIRRTGETGVWQATIGLVLGYIFPLIAYWLISISLQCVDQPDSTCKT